MNTHLGRGNGASLLGLSLDGSRLDGVLVRRNNGDAVLQRSFSASLSLDPLTHEAALVGREIRKHLDEAGIRERRCTVALPVSWSLTVSVEVPALAPGDREGFLALEAERGFPYAPETLALCRSSYRTASGGEFVTLVGISRDRIARLEAVLKAAQLRPVSFSLGVASLPVGHADPASGSLTLSIGAESISMQVSVGDGIAALRAMERTSDGEVNTNALYADVIAREARVTLGQLAPDVRANIRRLRIFGARDLAERLASEIQPRAAAMGVEVEPVTQVRAGDFPTRLPNDTPMSPALSLALRYLTGQGNTLEFLPPRVSGWQRFTSRYASRKLAGVSVAAGAVGLLVALAFLVQQAQLWHWQSKWKAMAGRVNELQRMQQQNKQLRPWFDASIRSLSILRRLTEAFPEDGAVSAKTVEIRDSARVTCSGTARNNQALLKALDQLRTAKEVSDVKVEQIRGRTPLEFTFNFQWGDQIAP